MEWVPAIGNACFWAVLGAWCFWLPGRLLVGRCLPDAGGVERFALAVFLGSLAVCISTFTVCSLAGLAAPVFVSRPAVVLVAGVWVLFSCGKARGGSTLPWCARDWWLLAAGLAVFGVFLVNFDRSLFHDAECLAETSFASLGSHDPAFPERSPATNSTWRIQNGFPQGGAALFAPFLALFEFAGFRILHAGCGMVSFLFGALALCRLGSPAALAAGAGAALALNAQVLSIAVPNENVLFLAASSGLFFLLVRPGLRGFWLGMVVAAVLGIGHPSILSMGAVAVAFAAHPARRRHGWSDLVAGTILFSIPWLLHHLVVSLDIGRPYWMETFDQFEPVPHSLFGIPFAVRALWNFPFVPEMVRSPYAAYPPAVLFPMRFVTRFGLVLAALVPLGAAALWRKDRRLLAALALWIVPAYGLLAAQANWTEEKKMGLLLWFLPPLVLLMGMGALAVRVWRWRGVAAWVASATAVGACFVALARIDFPVDERSYERRPHGHQLPADFPFPIRPESPDYFQAEKAREGRLHIVPDMGAVPIAFPPLARALVRDLADEVAHPRFDEVPRPIYDHVLEAAGLRRVFPSPLAAYRARRWTAQRRIRHLSAPPPDRSVDWHLRQDLSKPLVAQPLAGLSNELYAPCLLLIPHLGVPQAASSMAVPWSPEPLNALAMWAGPGGSAALAILFGGKALDERSAAPPAGRCTGAHGQRAIEPLGIEMHEGVLLTVMEIASTLPSRAYLWWIDAGPDGPRRIRGPVPYTVF